jgi:hypothetical protein
MSVRQKQLKEQYNAPGYPLMSVAEIHFLLEALGIAVTVEELSKPHAQIVQMIYSALLDSLMGAPMDMIEGPKGALMGMMEYKVGLKYERVRKGRLTGRSCIRMRCSLRCSSDTGEAIAERSSLGKILMVVVI